MKGYGKKMLKKLIAILFCLVLALAPLAALAASAETGTEARDITKDCVLTLSGEPLEPRVFDGDENTYGEFSSGAIGIYSREPIGGVYIRFDRVPGEWTLNAGSTARTCGTEGLLHEYQSVEGTTGEAILRFPGAFSISEITVLSKGEKLPAFVQLWRAAEGPADIMIMPCRTGDEQIFFAGAIADAVDRGAEVQVCLFMEHPNSHSRLHEFLNGLYACGLDRHPVIGPMPDVWFAPTEADALAIFAEAGYGYDDIVAYETELLRRFKPQIVLAHDAAGEDGYTAAIALSHAIREAVDASPNAARYPGSASQYGTWDPIKVYLHLWPENAIKFRIDDPLPSFGGMTAFEVSQKAYRLHYSQLTGKYAPWLLGTETAPVTGSAGFPAEYSPVNYGLWYDRTGGDTAKTGFYENIVFYADGGPLDPSTITEPTPEPTAEPTAEPDASAGPGETNAPVESAVPTEAPEPTAEPGDTASPTVPKSGKTLPPVIVVLILAALLAAAGAAMHFVIKANLD